jgi:hypothetical protein
MSHPTHRLFNIILLKKLQLFHELLDPTLKIYRTVEWGGNREVIRKWQISGILH